MRRKKKRDTIAAPKNLPTFRGKQPTAAVKLSFSLPSPAQALTMAAFCRTPFPLSRLLLSPFLLFSFLLFFPFLLFSQNDSTLLLAPERLTREDIVARNLDLGNTKVVSATRSPENPDDLPFTTWVVTAEDILRNGYVTLGDVLRAAPGIRVSQPGNAIEGETFLMRGLSGNQFVKILINDVPVKPSATLGMPIGAQLPIRQAERIEVLYGPASAIYGNEACAGVVNIILKETERPIFTQADLAFGNNGYNSLDLTFGGKLGKDKKIFRFSLYGSSTVREKTDIFYDRNLFNTNNYLPLGMKTSLYQNNRNFRATQPGDSLPKTAPVPHESRLLGINLTWRGIHLTYNRMARFDHSALGISPLAVSYSNPSNRLAELVETLSLGFTRTRPKWVTRNTLSAIRYQLNNTSTTTYVFDRLSAASYRVQAPSPIDDSTRNALLQNIFLSLASDERYTVANGFDVRFESRLNASLSPNLFLDLGAQVNAGGGTPAMSHFRTPIEIGYDGSTAQPEVKPFSPVFYSDLDGSVFGQLKWRSKRFYLLGAAAVNYSVNHGIVLAPRAGALYRLDSTWALRANYAAGFRRPPMYAQTAYFILDLGGSVNASPEGLNATEKIHTWEAGLRYTKKGIRAEGVFFHEKVYRLARPGNLRQQLGFVAPWRYGWENDPGLALSMWGIQGIISSMNQELNLFGTRKRTVITGRTEIFFQYARGKERVGENRTETDDVFNAPRWQFQFRTFFTLNKFQLMLASNRQTAVLSKAVIYAEEYERKVVQQKYPTFRSWDLMARLYLSNHFLAYFQVQNVFNRHYAGLDATGTPDDLLYNPQQGRLIRFGVNYNMN